MATALFRFAPDVFRSVARQVGAKEYQRAKLVQMVVNYLVRESRFGEAWDFLEKNLELVTRSLYWGKTEPARAQLSAIRDAAEKLGQSKKELLPEAVCVISRNIAEQQRQRIS